MKKTATFIAPIYCINVSEPLSRGDKLDDTLWLTNESDLVRSKMPDRLTLRIGTLERDATCQAGLVAYGEFAADNYPANASEAEGMIAVQLAKLHYFVQMLWLVKDNAANVENGFLDSPDTVSSRIWSMSCLMADGTEPHMTFTRDELRDARTLYRNLSGMEHFGLDDLKTASRVEVVEPESAPFSRAVFFISTARSSNHLSVKIANYCSALEALLITSPTELTYRLCQRVAWLIGDSNERRHEVFQQLKTGYDFRSKAVHGSYVSARKLQNDLKPAVVACDRILRDVLSKVVGDDLLRPYILGETKNSDHFEERLLRLTLGADQAGNQG